MKPQTITHWDCVYCTKDKKCAYHYDYNTSETNSKGYAKVVNGP